jgi:hypothetical protein
MKQTIPADLTVRFRRTATLLPRLETYRRGRSLKSGGYCATSRRTGSVFRTSVLRSPVDAILCMCLCVLPASCTATNIFYVAAIGSDANPGTEDAPFLTIAHADSCASAGDTIHVAPGTYKVAAPSRHSNGIVTTKDGKPSARIRFVSDIKGGAKIIVSGIGTAWHSKGSYVDIEGFDISGSGRHGILAAGRNLLISNNFIHDLTISGGCNGNGGAGIDTYGPVGNIVIYANVVRNVGEAMMGSCNTVHGIYIASPNNIVTNNIVSGAAAVGINQWHGATASTIINNTVFHNKIGILLGQGDGGATSVGSENNYVANNIVYDNRTYGVVEGGKMGTSNQYLNNLVHSNGTNWGVKGSVSGTISSDPRFVDYQTNGSGDYRLQTTSPAAGKGARTDALPTVSPGSAAGTLVNKDVEGN